MKNTTIEIDLELYKFIQSKLISFDEKPNDVLKRILKISDSLETNRENSKSIPPSGFTYKNVFFENGFEMRKITKGKIHTLIAQDGYFLLNGKKYTSPSSAGMSISNGAVNGWIYWEYKDEKSKLYRPIDYLRKKTS